MVAGGGEVAYRNQASYAPGGAEREGTGSPGQGHLGKLRFHSKPPDRDAVTEVLRGLHRPALHFRLSHNGPVGLDGAGGERSWAGKFQTELVKRSTAEWKVLPLSLSLPPAPREGQRTLTGGPGPFPSLLSFFLELNPPGCF